MKELQDRLDQLMAARYAWAKHQDFEEEVTRLSFQILNLEIPEDN